MSKEITKDELIRCLRAQVEHYQREAATLRFRIEDLEETNDGLRDDNMNLEAMIRSAHARLYNLQPARMAA